MKFKLRCLENNKSHTSIAIVDSRGICHVEVTAVSFITLSEIADRRTAVLDAIKDIRNELSCSQLKAKKIVEIIRATDDGQ